MIKKKDKPEKEFEPDYRKNNWGWRGRDFTVGQKAKLKCHQTASGTLYIKDKNGSLRKVTPELLQQLQDEADAIANAVQNPTNTTDNTSNNSEQQETSGD